MRSFLYALTHFHGRPAPLRALVLLLVLVALGSFAWFCGYVAGRGLGWWG